MNRFENVGVFIQENVWPDPKVFPYKYPNILKPSHPLYLPAYEDGTDSVPKRRHLNSDAGELPRKKHTTYRTWQKFEIKNTSSLWGGNCKKRWNRQSVPKRRYLKFRCRGITQKKA
jgi:hypothetical protein